MTTQATTPIRARAITAAALLVGALALAGCTARVTFDPSGLTPMTVASTSGAGYLIVQIPASRPPYGIEVLTPGVPTVIIPADHYPPVGACRIWLRDLAPEQQDAPGACSDLERQVPPGAYLIYG